MSIISGTGVSEAYAKQSAAYLASAQNKKTEVNDAGAAKSTSSASAKKTAGDYGKTIGQPELSEKAAEYYEELKKKYGKLDFVLVSKDMKEAARQQAGTFANPNKMVVLIDEEKIEKMAEDEEYRKKYEGIITNASSGLATLKEMTAGNANVKGYGMMVNDGGTASFFAVLKDSSKAQKERIEKKAEEKKEAKKAEEKKEAKEAAKEAAAEKIDDRPDWDETGITIKDDEVVLYASSAEELLKKIEEYDFNLRADSVLSEAELSVGQNIDFRG